MVGAARDLADVHFFLFETECQFYSGWQCTQLTNKAVDADPLLSFRESGMWVHTRQKALT